MKAFTQVLTIPALSLALAGCATANRSLEQQIAQLELADEEIAFVCPMHADVTSETPGSCEKCGMALVQGTPFDMRDYRLETSFVPEVPKPGETVRVNFKVMRPDSDETITDFELVHEMPYHLFVISQDLEYFQHLHPNAGENGTWWLDIVLPKAGHYALISDFAPKGAASQMTLRPLVTAGAGEDLLEGTSALTLDASPTSSQGGITATVSFDPPVLVAGQHGHLIFTLRDTATGAPITELQTYLGAFGHLFVIDEEVAQFVHSHPVETPSPQLDLNQIRGGPTVMFEGLMPKPGRYRGWAQFKYRDELYTFSTTFDVEDVADAFSR